MTDTAPQVQVNAIEEDSGDVLAEAAVASAALSGAAAAKADAADTDAKIADQKADAAGTLAAGAAAEAASKPDEARVEAIVNDKLTAALNGLADVLKPQAPAVEATAVVEAPPERDTPPASIKKKARKQTFAQRYMGVEPKDD